jgi:hypothetical protein
MLARSLVALSLVLSGFAYAEEADTLQQQEGEESSEKKETPAAAQEAPSAQKKMKPHFAGVRRSPETPPKKTRKIKNQWFSSKTQPKADRKEGRKEKEEAAELPEDRPYFVKTQYSFPAEGLLASNDSISSSKAAPPEESEGHNYPRTGFLAPRGHVILFGDWLYWRTRQEGMEFATGKQVTFDFQSGFRVGVGAHLPSFDGWTIIANYTRFVPKGSRNSHETVYPLFLFQGAGSTGNTVTESHGHWRVQFQSADLAFGKAYYLTQTLVFSPFFGLKGAWIDQHAKFHYAGGYIPSGQTFTTHFKNDSKGAGPLIGTQMNWQLGAGFCFFADVATALVACHFNNLQTQHQIGGAEVVHLSTDFNLLTPFLQLIAGIGWDRNFHHEMCHFGLSLGFEAQQWWNQNQTEQFTDDVRPTYMRQRGDLSFYGLTLRARFDF